MIVNASHLALADRGRLKLVEWVHSRMVWLPVEFLRRYAVARYVNARASNLELVGNIWHVTRCDWISIQLPSI